MSKKIKQLAREASFACDLHSDDALKVIQKKVVEWKDHTGKVCKSLLPDNYNVIDTLAANGPEVIFEGTHRECMCFLIGVKWGAGAGRSSMAQSF